MMSGQVRRIGAELSVVLLVLLSLVITFGLVKKAYETAPPAQQLAITPPRPPEPKPEVIVAELEATPEPTPAEPTPAADPEPEPDPTAVELARLAEQTDQQKATALASDAEVTRLLQDLGRLKTEQQKWSQRKLLVKNRSRQLDKLVGDLEKSLPSAEKQRAKLADIRDQKMQELAQANAHKDQTYSVTPYKGPSGTWRQPILVDCAGDSVRVLPDGKIHGSAELGPIPNARALSLVYEVRKKAAELEEVLSPDGAASVPYILFLVRPDGIRHYYQARTLLESTRIAFGYELVGQDWVIDAHESQKPSRVEGSTDIARAKPRARTGQRSANQPQDEDDDLYVWPNNALKGADGPAQTGQIVELPQGQGARVLTALNDRDGTEAFGPGDLLEPPMRKVTDPRRPTGTGNDPDGTEIITGQNRGGGDVNRPGQGPAGRTPTPAVMQSNRPGSAVGSETGGARVAEPPMPGSSAGAGSLAVRQPPVPGANSRSPFAPGTAGANGSGPSEHLIASVAGSQGLQNGSTSVAGVPDAAGVQNAAQPSSGRPGSNRLGQVADQLLGSGSGLHSTDTAAGTAAGATASGQPGTAAGATASGQPGTATGAVGGSSGTPVGAGSGMGQSRAGTGHSPSQGASSPSGTGSSSGSPGASNSGGFGFGAPSPDATNSNGQGESSWLSTPGGSGSESGLPPRVSEEWLDIVIACQSDGLTIQPGGYRLTLEKLQSTSLFNDRLKSIANRHGRDDRGRIRRPRLRYVVESGGQDSFWQARRQSSFIGMDWPATIQLADSISWDRWLFEEKTR